MMMKDTDFFAAQRKKLDKKERRLLEPTKENLLQRKIKPLHEVIQAKIPPFLAETLENVFFKAFETVFQKGTKYIEKTYDKEKLLQVYQTKNEKVDTQKSPKSLRELDAPAKKSKLLNTSLATLEGGGLGFLGLGMPDIPLFISMLLKNIYEITLSYGFTYDSKGEKIYILHLICAAMSEGEERVKYNAQANDIAARLDMGLALYENLEESMRETSQILSRALLIAKFIQGYPVVGLIGGAVNNSVMRRVGKYAAMKYKKRYLLKKV